MRLKKKKQVKLSIVELEIKQSDHLGQAHLLGLH